MLEVDMGVDGATLLLATWCACVAGRLRMGVNCVPRVEKVVELGRDITAAASAAATAATSTITTTTASTITAAAIITTTTTTTYGT